MNLKYTVLLLFISCNAYSQLSVLNNQETLQRIERGIDNLYNFQFDSISETEQYLHEEYPDNPLPPLFSALTIYWKHFPVTPNSMYHDLYVENINRSIQKSEHLLEQNADFTEAIFLNLMARLLIMQYYADNHQSSKVMPHASRGYSMVKKGFDLTDSLTDFNFSTGLYNYYRVAYPEKHPVYKPIAYFFREGDKKHGLNQLEYNWKHGIFLDAEALSFLVFISLNFEENYKKSLRFTRELYQSYPNNLLYLSYRIRTLLLLEKYHKANPLIHELDQLSQEKPFFQMMVHIYKGIVAEKKHQDFKQAEKFYRKAIDLGNPYKPFANDRISYAYFGLSRIYINNDVDLSKKYREMANNLSSYSHINFD